MRIVGWGKFAILNLWAHADKIFLGNWQLMNRKKQISFYSLLVGVGLFCTLPYTPIMAAPQDKLKLPASAMECIKCHISKNTTAARVDPKLSGQHAKYIIRQILDFQGDRRKDPVMSPIAEKLNRRTIVEIAKYFSKQPVTTEKQQSDYHGDTGRQLYIEDNCSLCHHTKTIREFSNLPHGPVIAGQRRDYLVKAMHDIKKHKRPADVFELMHRILDDLSDKDIEALADYISTHSPDELQKAGEK